MTNKFLLAVDGSSGSNKAAKFATERAKLAGAQVIVAYVIEWSPYTFNTPEENAERHKRNPDFVDDAMETIKGSVKRMRRIMRHLRQGAVDQQTERVDLTKVMLEVVSKCSDKDPAPVMSAPDHAVVVQGNRERLSSAILHAVRNAQEASDVGGKVTLEIETSGAECRLRIVDSGCGMDSNFVRERLFRPFDSTKGSEGMGIGAYQIRETLRASKGDVVVQSAPGVGTTMVLRLPLLESNTQ
jgi:signal transduction histidine kinase